MRDLLLALCIEWLIFRLRSTAREAELVDRNLNIYLLTSWKKGFDSLLGLTP